MICAPSLATSLLTGLAQIQQSSSPFCSGQLAAGRQNPQGFCSATPMGALPDTSHMVSSLITSPQSGATMRGPFTVTVQTRNLNTGFGLDPQQQYLLAPQTVGANGCIEGVMQISIQQIQSQDAPDALDFSFFRTLDSKTSGSGTFTVRVPQLKTGRYRICTMAAAASFQPVIMPVAKRGAQDDCIRITVR